MALKLNIRLDETFSGHNQKKEHCPSCNKKRFVRFYNFAEQEYLPEQFGRCDRQEHCGYYLSPYSENSEFIPSSRTEQIEVPEVAITYVDKQIVARSLAAYETNTFVQFLISRVGKEKAMATVFKFYIGTAKNNGTVFWQIDQFNKPRTGAKIHYMSNGHRNKEIEPKRLFMLKDGYKPCLFGEHQLFDFLPNSLCVIVESEKTAILGECYMNTLNGRPLLWLASSGSNGLTFDKIQCLRGKDVLLIPDFSFHARATWGLLPMRKKPNEKGILSIDEDGEIVDYESAKDRLISIGCKVDFFNPNPELNDGSDIGDIFASEEAPEDTEPEEPAKVETKIDQPDFGKFSIINAQHSNLKPRTFDESISIASLLSGKHGIILSLGTDKKVQCQMNNIVLQEKMNGFFNSNPMLSEFIHKFDLTGGYVTPFE